MSVVTEVAGAEGGAVVEVVGGDDLHYCIGNEEV